MHVICTAGHVDHGKSTLVRALTGIEPDRFDEERRRGLTIDLGFAWTEIAGETVAFVDLPGHERFIGNMLAGAGAVRLALFVVAADEGWMPQSAEHLAILDLLGLDGGVVALTRADLVDADTAELGVELAREELAGTVLADAPILPVSAATGAGLDALREALADLVRDAAARTGTDDVGRPRLWVDRSFSVAGAGTVVTGTLAGGRLATGDEVTVLPGRVTARVRGLQQLHRQVEESGPGRVAVNLAGLPREAVVRGHAIVRGAWEESSTVDVFVRAVGQRAIGRRGAWHLHAGSAERVTRVEPWSGDVEPAAGGPDDGGMLRLRFTPPLALQAGDRFVLRESGARETVGGGIVLDPAPPARPRGRAARARRVAQLERRRAALAAGDRTALLHAAVGEAGAAERVLLARSLGLDDVDTRARETGLVELGTTWAAPEAVEVWTSAAHQAVAAFHRAHPLSIGPTREQVRSSLRDAGCPPEGAPADLGLAVLATCERKGLLVGDGPILHLPDHRVALDAAQDEQRQALLAALDEHPFRPPDLDDAAAACGAPPELVRALEATGDLVRLNERVALTADAFAAAVARLRDVFERTGPFTAAEARETLDTTRKYVVPLLEELDRRGVTRRMGDRRELPPARRVDGI